MNLAAIKGYKTSVEISSLACDLLTRAPDDDLPGDRHLWKVTLQLQLFCLRREARSDAWTVAVAEARWGWLQLQW